MSSAAKRIEELQERDTALDHLLAAIDERLGRDMAVGESKLY